MIEVFGIAFSIMGLLPSIASTLAYSIPAGPVGLVWVSLRTSVCRIFVKVGSTESSSTVQVESQQANTAPNFNLSASTRHDLTFV